MIAYKAGGGPLVLPDSMAYDVNEKAYYSLTYRPTDWAANTEVIEGVDVVIPTTPNGFYYECSSSGITDASEPTFATSDGSETADNSASWTAKTYDLLLNTGDTITVSTWVGTNGETIDNETIVSSIQTKFRITGTPNIEETATIVNHVTVLRSGGDTEEFDRSIVIPIKVL